MAFYHFVRRYFVFLLLLLLAGNFVVYRLMHENSGAMKNRHAPLGIISLEIATTQTKINSIIYAWSQTPVTFYGLSDKPEHFSPYTALDVARRQTKLDYFFLVFYSLILALLLVRLAPEENRHSWIRRVVVLSLITGLLDVVENIFMLRAMTGRPVTAWTIWLPSGIKWLVVFVLAVTILIRFGIVIARSFKKQQPQ